MMVTMRVNFSFRIMLMKLVPVRLICWWLQPLVFHPICSHQPRHVGYNGEGWSQRSHICGVMVSNVVDKRCKGGWRIMCNQRCAYSGQSLKRKSLVQKWPPAQFRACFISNMSKPKMCQLLDGICFLPMKPMTYARLIEFKLNRLLWKPVIYHSINSPIFAIKICMKGLLWHWSTAPPSCCMEVAAHFSQGPGVPGIHNRFSSPSDGGWKRHSWWRKCDNKTQHDSNKYTI